MNLNNLGLGNLIVLIFFKPKFLMKIQIVQQDNEENI